jgi:regulatory protein
MNYLARREHSQEELRLKLSQRGFSERLINEVIGELRDENLQSDARFAEVFTRSRVAKGYGVYRIRQELRQRGIAEGDSAEMAAMDWDAQIEKIYDRKFGGKFPESLTDRAARERYLLRRGFTGDQVLRLFRRLREGGSDER